MRYTDPRGLVPNPGELTCLGGPNLACGAAVAADIITSIIGLSAGVEVGNIIFSKDTPSDDAKDEVQGGTGQCAANDNEPDDKNPCKQWYSDLKVEYAGIALLNLSDLHKAAYNENARNYNRTCMPQGHPSLPLFEF